MLVLCFAAVCTAQRYTFKEYTEGLSNLNVRSMLQDRTGFLWIGTENGILRYDGARFKEFGRSQGLFGTWVLAMHLDQSGRLWVGTDGGLSYLSEEGRFISIPFHGKPIRLLSGSTISSDASGSVLAISDDGLLKLTRAGGPDWSCHLLVANESLQPPAQDLTSILVSRDGSVFAGCGTGLCQLSEKGTVLVSQRDGLPPATWNTLYEDRAGRIWTRGLSHVATLSPSGRRVEVHDLPQPASGQLLPQFAEDAQGNVITGLNNSIARFEHGRWRVFSRANGLAAVPVESVFVDREGSLWIGYMGHGLRKWLGYGRWEHWTSEDGLNANSVWAIQRDHMGRLWIGDEDGLAVQDASSQKFKP
jgi:ligand-binding sensor domain-containing protein